MRSIFTLCLALVVVAFFGCGNDSSPTDPNADVFVVVDPPYDMSAPPDGGTCPDIFYESDKLLPNGITVTWTSAFGGFDYEIGTPYAATVTWSLSGGSATFVAFGQRTRGKTFTPRGSDSAEGTVGHAAPGASSVDITVTMSDMHWAVDPDFQGDIGNGHFWLILDVDDGQGNIVRAKLGVNTHLEDPDANFSDRCPE